MKRLVYCLFVMIAFGINLAAQDVHSYANPSAVRVRHVDLDWDVLFDQKVLKGTATLTVERSSQTEPLIVDTRDLKIERVETSANGVAYTPETFTVGTTDKILGAPLTIPLPAGATRVRIHYSTSPGASGLQWLAPAQTAGKKDPFMFTQSQAIHARSWIPLQDTPAVRVTYSARVRTPRNLLAVMSAENDDFVCERAPAGKDAGDVCCVSERIANGDVAGDPYRQLARARPKIAIDLFLKLQKIDAAGFQPLLRQ